MSGYPECDDAYREGQLSMTEDKDGTINAGDINVSGGHIISGGGGFVAGIVITLLLALLVGGLFCDDCEAEPASEPAVESPAPEG